jgi:hypothetical protein
MQHLLQSLEIAGYSGAQLVLGNQGELGKKQEWKLIVRIPGQNSGMVIAIKSTLSWMSLEEASISHTFCDGLTAIQYELRLKEAVDR